ncbi:hypothetical protein M404DRAFT_996899 [Pisolithus tinctorius Marx 270]|uniref:Uncharacterized protein n=1 Tax=Pisolithus tinctorius Marx 270 TaxID=870435 RepID=A0A0C3PKV0_PISTI|nr:hypothetical protein M404DRAFT_996899 [Pisolithus tinctorius Marx 270]
MPNSELESTIKSPNDDLAYASATIARLWTELEFERCEHRKTVEGANHRIEGPEELEAQVAIRETELETCIRLSSQSQKVFEGDTGIRLLVRKIPTKARLCPKTLARGMPSCSAEVSHSFPTYCHSA